MKYEEYLEYVDDPVEARLLYLLDKKEERCLQRP